MVTSMPVTQSETNLSVLKRLSYSGVSLQCQRYTNPVPDYRSAEHWCVRGILIQLSMTRLSPTLHRLHSPTHCGGRPLISMVCYETYECPKSAARAAALWHSLL